MTSETGSLGGCRRHRTLGGPPRIPGARRVPAFTLLEMLITLGVIALFAGYFVLRFDDGRTEEALTQASSELRIAALRSKRQSYAFRQDRHIVLVPGGFVATDRPLPEDYLPGVGELPSGAAFTALPRGVRMEWQLPGSPAWESREPFVWSFRSSGLSDPIAVRFTFEHSYTLLRFNVLTGLADEETYIES